MKKIWTIHFIQICSIMTANPYAKTLFTGYFFLEITCLQDQILAESACMVDPFSRRDICR